MSRHVLTSESVTEGHPDQVCDDSSDSVLDARLARDPSKVDRSAACFGRSVARRIVRRGLARRAEIQLADASGEHRPLSVKEDTHGTGDPRLAERFVRETFDFRPWAMIEQLRLRRPICRQTTNHGHFGRPGLPWER